MTSLIPQVVIGLVLLGAFLLLPKARVEEQPPQSFRERIQRDLGRDV